MAQILHASIMTFLIDNYLFNTRSTLTNTYNVSANIGQHRSTSVNTYITSVNIGQHPHHIDQHSINTRQTNKFSDQQTSLTTSTDIPCHVHVHSHEDMGT